MDRTTVHAHLSQLFGEPSLWLGERESLRIRVGGVAGSNRFGTDNSGQSTDKHGDTIDSKESVRNELKTRQGIPNTASSTHP